MMLLKNVWCCFLLLLLLKLCPTYRRMIEVFLERKSWVLWWAVFCRLLVACVYDQASEIKESKIHNYQLIENIECVMIS